MMLFLVPQMPPASNLGAEEEGVGIYHSENTSSQSPSLKLLTATPVTTRRCVLEWELGGGSPGALVRCWEPSGIGFSANLRAI